MTDLNPAVADELVRKVVQAASDKRPAYLQYRLKPKLRHITEITEEDDAKSEVIRKFQTAGDADLQTTAATESAELTPPEKSKWSWLQCLSCLSFLRMFRQAGRQAKQKDVLREIRLIKQQTPNPVLPTQSSPNRKTLVLDLDQTLVHSSFTSGPLFDFKVKFELGGKPVVSYVRKRFGVDYFLNQMSKHYELVLFTAATREYAEKVIDYLDPKRLVEHRLYRQHCTQVNRLYFKNLSILNRKLKNVILLDNSRSSGMLQLQNLLLIESFFQNEKDRQLLRFVPLLKHLANINDVRPVCKRKISFDSKEIYINPSSRGVTAPGSQTPSEASPKKIPMDVKQNGRRRLLHVRRNSELESLVKKEEGLSGEETDNKLVAS